MDKNLHDLIDYLEKLSPKPFGQDSSVFEFISKLLSSPVDDTIKFLENEELFLTYIPEKEGSYDKENYYESKITLNGSEQYVILTSDRKAIDQLKEKLGNLGLNVEINHTKEKKPLENYQGRVQEFSIDDIKKIPENQLPDGTPAGREQTGAKKNPPQETYRSEHYNLNTSEKNDPKISKEEKVFGDLLRGAMIHSNTTPRNMMDAKERQISENLEGFLNLKALNFNELTPQEIADMLTGHMKEKVDKNFEDPTLLEEIKSLDFEEIRNAGSENNSPPNNLPINGNNQNNDRNR